MIHHHPDDELLLGLAAGTLDGGTWCLVAVHAEGCAHCRARISDYEAVGGALLEAAEPASLAPEALARTLARIDAPPAAAVSATGGNARAVRAHLPDGLPWPRSLRGCSIGRWRWLGPGMRWSRVALPHDQAANVFLLRIAAGKCLPRHTHSDSELTQVLYGTFDDGRARVGPGDFDVADGSILHQPVVLTDGECVCLASVRGKVRFEGAIARVLGAVIGM